MSKRKPKREALTVSRLIHEVLVEQLSIPLRQIVNDTSFAKWTGSERPDILISEFEFDGNNEQQFVENIVGYAEAKDSSCKIDDAAWRDAIKQGKSKAKKLNLPYFIVTNCKSSVFYNAKNGKEITLNRNSIREFQTIDILRLIRHRLSSSPNSTNIQTSVDSISTISEAIFNKKLWELATIYRGINFKDNLQKIDFTIGFVSLEFFEEKSVLDSTKDSSKIYWSECADQNDEKLVANIDAYIRRLSNETSFKEFNELIGSVRKSIVGSNSKAPLVSSEDVRSIYDVIESMRPLHGAGFDLFGAVYEMFASTKEKKEFGEYFTRRHYAHVLAKLLLRNEEYFNEDRKFAFLDPACGTGGFLTEAFKVLKSNYECSNTNNPKAKKFLERQCLFGVDVREENISRTKLNMFLVGDGHTNMQQGNTLKKNGFPFAEINFDYIISNPPYGAGTIKAETSVITTERTEIAFLCKIRKLLKVGGKACVILPDGVLENPSWKAVRKELLETCVVDAIISLPKFAFAPYTKEKTYALFITKHSEQPSKIQTTPIWFYIIDNDGLANSDKRFPTKLRNNRNGWMHDEISGWVTTDGEEMPGLLEERWLNFDDKASRGTAWMSEKGKSVRKRKASVFDPKKLNRDYVLLPEYYLRRSLKKQRKKKYKCYQQKGVAANQIFSVISGNSGITEEYIYSLLLHEEKKKYKLLTGSVDPDNSIKIHHCRDPKNADRKIRVHSGEALHVVRKGKAGHVNYLSAGHYTLNDDAYLLTISTSCELKISLEWFSKTQRDTFLEFSSNSDNGTWNKGGFLSHAKFDIPDYDEQIDELKLHFSK